MKVGIVGCGWVSGLHINAWRDAGMFVAAACDVNEKTAMQFAEKWKIPSYYTDLAEMLKNEDLFAISICAPPKFHADLAIKALESGCHVVVEKPFTVTTKEADKVMNTLQNSSAKLTIIHSQLFEPSMLLAMKRIRAGAIGGKSLEWKLVCYTAKMNKWQRMRTTGAIGFQVADSGKTYPTLCIFFKPCWEIWKRSRFIPTNLGIVHGCPSMS